MGHNFDVKMSQGFSTVQPPTKPPKEKESPKVPSCSCQRKKVKSETFEEGGRKYVVTRRTTRRRWRLIGAKTLLPFLIATFSFLVLCLAASAYTVLKIIDLQRQVDDLSRQSLRPDLQHYDDDDLLKEDCRCNFESLRSDATSSPFPGNDQLSEEDDNGKGEGEDAETESRIRRDSSLSQGTGMRGVNFLNLAERFRSGPAGKIKHWVPDPQSISRRHLLDDRYFQMTDQDSTVTIREPGLYLVYSQLYFESLAGSLNQYAIKVRQNSTGPRNNARQVAKCSGVVPRDVLPDSGNLSCSTFTVQTLNRGDQIYLDILQLDRIVNGRDGHSFWGLVKLT